MIFSAVASRRDDGRPTPGAEYRDHPWRVAASSGVVIAVAYLAVTVYLLLFQVTKISPLSSATFEQQVNVICYAMVAVVALTIVTTPVAWVGDWAARRGRGATAPPIGTLTVVTVICSLGCLVLTENMLYTVAGVGLKTDTTAIVKFAFITFSIVAGVSLARMTVKGLASHERRVIAATAMIALAIPAAIFTSIDLLSMDAAPVAKTSGPAQINVVILSADGVDAQHLSVYGYPLQTSPFLESRASEFRIFENAFTNNGNTTGSITSMLTGMSPIKTGVVFPPDRLNADDAARTLPQLLGGLGYYRSNWAVPHYADGRTQNLVGAFDVDNGYQYRNSPVARIPLGTGLGRWFIVDSIEQTIALAQDAVGYRELQNPYDEVGTEEVDTGKDADRLAGVLHEIRTQDKFFINTHFMVTHGPRFVLSQRLFSRGKQQSFAWQSSFYDDAIRQFDSYIGDVYRELRATGNRSHVDYCHVRPWQQVGPR